MLINGDLVKTGFLNDLKLNAFANSITIKKTRAVVLATSNGWERIFNVKKNTPKVNRAIIAAEKDSINITCFVKIDDFFLGGLCIISLEEGFKPRVIAGRSEVTKFIN